MMKKVVMLVCAGLMLSCGVRPEREKRAMYYLPGVWDSVENRPEVTDERIALNSDFTFFWKDSTGVGKGSFAINENDDLIEFTFTDKAPRVFNFTVNDNSLKLVKDDVQWRYVKVPASGQLGSDCQKCPECSKCKDKPIPTMTATPIPVPPMPQQPGQNPDQKPDQKPCPTCPTCPDCPKCPDQKPCPPPVPCPQPTPCPPQQPCPQPPQNPPQQPPQQPPVPPQNPPRPHPGGCLGGIFR